MSRTLTQSFKTQKDSLTNSPIRLYIVEDGPLSPTILRLAEYPENVSFGGNTYIATPIKCEAVSENASQEIDQVTIHLGNVDRSFVSYLENNDGLRTCKVTIRIVFANLLSESDAYTDDIFYVASAVMNQMSASFLLKSKLDVMHVELPLRRFYRNTCQWGFKSTECGYAGAETSCNHTNIRCGELNNIRRFGGFSGVSNALWRVFVG